MNQSVLLRPGGFVNEGGGTVACAPRICYNSKDKRMPSDTRLCLCAMGPHDNPYWIVTKHQHQHIILSSIG